MKTNSSTDKRPYPKEMGNTFGEAVRKMGGWKPYYDWLKKLRSPVVVAKKIGRNQLVTIKKGDAVKVLKYKKAQRFLNDGWIMD